MQTKALDDNQDKNVYRIFSENLKGILSKRKMTQKDFAKRLDVTAGTVSKYVSGGYFPTGNKLTEICNILEIEVFELFSKRSITEYEMIEELIDKKIHENQSKELEKID